jgi:hypothetical protein
LSERGGNLQSFTIITSLGRDIKGDPAIRFFQRYYPNVLEIGGTGSSPDAHGRRRIRIVEGKAEKYREFLDSNLGRELDGDKMRLGTVRATVALGKA